MGHKKAAPAVESGTAETSLSNLLLKKSPKDKVLDSELDSIFKTSAGAALSPPVPKPPIQPIEPIPSTQQTSSEIKSNKSSKRKALDIPEPPSVTSNKRRKSSGETQVAGTESTVPTKTKSKKRKQAAGKDSSDEAPDATETSGDLEDQYHARSRIQRPSAIVNSTTSGDDNVDGDDDAIPQHESVGAGPSRKKVKAPKTKYIPPDETKEQRDERTIFIGNLPADVAKSKSALKGLTRLITTSVPGSKIESTRFRSVAFQNPTAELPKSDDEADKPKTKTSARPPVSDDLDDVTSRMARQQGRAARWREQDDVSSEKPGTGKTFLTPAEKKRVAFIKGELHAEGTTVHAYVVFAHEEPGRSRNVPPVLNPYEAAKLAVETCDGKVYMDRTIRVDHVRGSGGAAAPGAKSGTSSAQGHFDTRRTLFVGGLDFQTKEEDLRAFFEKILVTERGEAEAEADSGEEDAAEEAVTTSRWVSHVRLIRDQDTQLGKGIAYVEFKDRNALDEIIALEASKLKLNKRKIRVERCKNKTATSATKAPRVIDGERAVHGKPKAAGAPGRPSAASTGPGPRTPKPTPISIPKGDPTLGDRLKGLDKDARRAAKAADAERLARRLAKKKARHALDDAGVRGSKGKSAGGVLGSTKSSKPKIKAKVSRVRNEKSASKRNAKK